MATDSTLPAFSLLRRPGARLLRLPRRALTALQRGALAAFCWLGRLLQRFDPTGDWTGAGP